MFIGEADSSWKSGAAGGAGARSPRLAADGCAAAGAEPQPWVMRGGKPLLGEAAEEVARSFELESPGSAVVQLPSWRLAAAVLVCLFSPLLFGFTMGFTSPAQSSMEDRTEAEDPRVALPPPPHLAVFTPSEFTLYAAIASLGAGVGAFAGAAAMDRVGRARALALSALPHAAAWAGMSLASDGGALAALRVLAGCGVGMGSAIAPAYISEVSPAHLRGTLGAAFQLALNLGYLVVNAAGRSRPFVVEADSVEFSDWRALCLLGLAFAAVLSLMACMPESPAWLVRRGRTHQATMALRALRRGDTSMEETAMSSILSETSRTETPGIESTRGASLSDCRRSLVVAVGLMALQQLSGVNAVGMYTADICAKAGMGDGAASAMAIMAAQVCLTALSCLLVESAGRRSLLRFAMATMFAAHVGLSLCTMAQEHEMTPPPWIALFFLCLYVAGYSLGMGPVPWIIVSEIFPVEAVGIASAISTAVGWTCAFVVCVGFRGLQDTLGANGAFLSFALCCFLGHLFATAFVPETRGKSLEQILSSMGGQGRSGATVGCAASVGVPGCEST